MVETPGDVRFDPIALPVVLGEERVVVAPERVVQPADLGIAAWMRRPEGADRLFVHRHSLMSSTRNGGLIRRDAQKPGI